MYTCLEHSQYEEANDVVSVNTTMNTFLRRICPTGPICLVLRLDNPLDGNPDIVTDVQGLYAVMDDVRRDP